MSADKEKEAGVEVEGVVVEAQKSNFRVEIGQSGDIVIAYLAGKLRKNKIDIVPGDKVRVELSPYDLKRGRITYRLK